MVDEEATRLAVIVPNYNGADLLGRYLPAVLECVDSFGTVTVVDDASTDGSVDFVRSRFPEVKVIARGENGGFSAAVNEGIRSTQSEFVLVLNNDVELTQGFLEPLMSLFDDESVFAVSPRILLPGRGFLDEGAKTGTWHHGMFYTGQVQGVDSVSPIIYATGCAAVYRRAYLEELGLFDEVYSPFYWEDVDLCYRAWKRGWVTLYQPASVVYHQHAATVSRFDQFFTSHIQSRNSFFFIWRNIEDKTIRRKHFLWLLPVLAKRLATGDRAFLAGFSSAWGRRREAFEACRLDSKHRILPDREIFARVGIEVR